ncbi:MAG TPA: S-layer homology domain-containing protein [Symbiobacteriaceae bacterium]|nr:S-layer homology domain-containing protein [Symbiobacteriaceae bacterium]
MKLPWRLSAFLTVLLTLSSLLIIVPAPPVAEAAASATKTTVVCDNQHPTPGGSTKCTATVTNTEGSATPTGTLTWTIAAQNASTGSGSLSAPTCSLSGSGTSASCSVYYNAPASGQALPVIKVDFPGVGNTIAASTGVAEVGVCPAGTRPTVSITTGAANTSVEDWGCVKGLFSDNPIDAGGGSGDLTQIGLSADGTNLYARWDYFMTNNKNSAASDGFSIDIDTTGGNTPNARVWVTIASNGVATAEVERPIGTFTSIGSANQTCISGCSNGGAVSVEGSFPLTAIGAGPDTIIGLMAQTRASASHQANVKDCVPGSPGNTCSGYFRMSTSNGDITISGAATTTTTVTCTPGSVNPGGSTTCTAQVSSASGAPTGSVVFTTNQTGSFDTNTCTLSGTSSPTSCSVTYTATAGGAATHTITASYAGDNYPTAFSGSSGTTSVTINLRSTSTTVSCSPNPVDRGSTTTCSATVTDTAGGTASSPTGTVTFPGIGSCTLSGVGGGAASCSVSYTPTAAGDQTVSASYGGDSTHSASSSSVGLTVNGPVASLTPASQGFGLLAISATSGPQSFTLTNTGTAVLTVSSIGITGTNAGDFAQTNNCGGSVAAGASCTINVTFTPGAAGARNAALSVSDNADGSPHTAALSGTGGYTLTVNQPVNGTVTTADGINCGASCSKVYAPGTTVTLTATPGAEYTFAGWGGACGGTGTCSVTIDSNRTVSAMFTIKSYNLTVNVIGAGTVTSGPEGINCSGGSCSASFTSGTVVTLTAAAGANAEFAAWNGDGTTTGAGIRSVTMTSAKSVDALFVGTQASQTITVTTPAPANATYGSSFPVAATATSNLPVIITASGACAITSNGTGSATVTMTSGVGTCTVHYNQPGNGSYTQAPEVTSNTLAGKAPLTVTADNASRPFGQGNPAFTATVSGFVNNEKAADVVTGLALCTTTADANSPVGTYDITCTKGTLAADNYDFTTFVKGTLTINKASQTITFAQPASPAAFGSTFHVAPTASSGLAVTVTASGGCTVVAVGDGYDVTMTSATTACVLTASQAGNANYSAAADIVLTVTPMKRSTTVSVSCTPGTTTLDVAVECTAVVTDTGSGTAQALDGSNVSFGITDGTGTFGAPTCTGTGPLTCTVSYTPTAGVGTHRVTATYATTVVHAGSSGNTTISTGPRLSTLTGTVKTDFDTAVIGIAVYAISGEMILSGSTDAQGAFSFPGLQSGDYTLKVKSTTNPLVTATVTLPVGGNAHKDLVIPSNAALSLTATPSTIIGNGVSTSQLQAELSDLAGARIPGVPVVWRTTSGTMTATDAQTGADGVAHARLIAADLAGADQRTETASVEVNDTVRGLFARAQVTMTFAPSALEGVVRDNTTQKPIAGATVTVLYPDGTPAAPSVTTGADGRYFIFVPKGHTNYQVRISAPMTIGGVERTIETTQSAPVGDISGTGESISAKKTIGGVVMGKDHQTGAVLTIDQVLSNDQTLVGELRTSTGEIRPNAVQIDADGSFQIDDVPVGDYQVIFRIKPKSGVELAGVRINISVNADGEMILGTGLIDPFGTVTDAVTNKPIQNVEMRLYWADTPVNTGHGRVPHTLVNLPELLGFEPNDNHNWQNTDQDGKYAWMVLPDGDYYIVATKAGYNRYDSRSEGRNVPKAAGEDSYIQNGVIHVGTAIVRYDLKLTPRPDDPPAPVVPPAPQGGIVSGIVYDSGAGIPVAGARVELKEDFNGDGTAEFTASAVTTADGKYQINVPRRNWTYRPLITAPVQAGALSVTGTATIQVPQEGNQAIAITAPRTIAGQLLFQELDGTRPAVLTAAQAARVTGAIKAANGTPVTATVTIGASGAYQVNGVLPAGTYVLDFGILGAGGRALAGTSITVPVTREGEFAAQVAVIKPFGTITDETSHGPIPGAQVTIYWADTDRNRTAGRSPGTEVILPGTPEFGGWQNKNPQLSTGQGQFGWLCFPGGDYYLIAKKDGYLPYDSRKDVRSLTWAGGALVSGIIRVETGSCSQALALTLKPMPKDQSGQHLSYVKGYPDGLFRPEASITRAEVAAVFARILQSSPQQNAASLYGDVPAGHWAAGYIAVVSARGLMKGDPSGNFRPGAPITRAELATVMARYKELSGVSGTVFSDTAGHWAEPAINAVFAAGIALGYGDNSFKPSGTTTRAEFVTMVDRVLGRGPLATGNLVQRWPDVPEAHWAVGYVAEASFSHKYRPGQAGYEQMTEMTSEVTW